MKADDFAKHLEGLEKTRTDAEAARQGVPENVDGYKVEFPKEFKLPDGYELDEKDPRLAALRETAHKAGWSKDTFNQVVKIEADRLVADAENLKQAVAIRDKALGENGAARVDALGKWIDTLFDDDSKAFQVKQTMWTPVIVELFESFQKQLSGQGVLGHIQSGREEPGNGLPAGWDKMSPSDRLIWNRQHAKDKGARAR